MITLEESLELVQKVWNSTFSLSSPALKSERVYSQDGSYWWAVIRNRDGSNIDVNNITNSDFNLGFFDNSNNKRIMLHFHPDRHNREWHLQTGDERYFFEEMIVNSLCDSSTTIVKKIVEKVNND